MGSITTGQIGDDPFYRFPSKLREPWGATESEAYAPNSYMEFKADVPSGGAGLSGIEIIWADQSETFISAADVLENYAGQDYWSVVFDVTSNTFDKTTSFDSTQDLWDDTGTDQSVYRLRVVTLNGDSDPTSISMYGQYRESILCVNGEPVTVLVKIS